MPELDGIAATRELSRLLPSTPVIVLSAYEDPALIREAHQAGAYSYLVKGCRVSVLVEEIAGAAVSRADSASPAAALSDPTPTPHPHG